ncbi:MAG: cache domain-containing protein [candidate division Zixibacteria bacterium]|nr:cache domain-containing protein [candidate division Zixibacteria bacterium]
MSWKNAVWFRLNVGFIAIILVTNVVLFLVTLFGISEIIIEEVQTRVRMDLNSADKVFNEHIGDICLLLKSTSVRRAVPIPLESWDREDLHKLMQSIWQAGDLDILSLLDTDGRVIYREHNPGQMGDDISHNPIVARAMREKKCFRGVAIVSYEELKKESSDILHRASIEIKSAKVDQSGMRKIHRDGMVIGAAVPLVDLRRDREIVGFLYGAKLLNQSYEIVDEIKEDLYQNESYQGRDIGVTTIFQGDVRISTNLTGKNVLRAVGTRVSSVVYKQVVEMEKIWTEQAFVIDDWYITAYKPICNPESKVIGILGVGVLEKAFVHDRKLAMWLFLGVVIFITVISLILLTLMTRTVLRPIGRIIKMSDKVVAGDLSARVNMRLPGEMGMLCLAIDQMADAISQREEALALATRQKIDQSEKMASIGRMSAGIAHEINNPLTGLLTFEHLLKNEEGLSDKGKEYLEIMYNETSRVREIVMGLLNFSRESSLDMKLLDINEVIRQWLKSPCSQKEFKNITTEKKLTEGLPKVNGDTNQLQQVLTNLCFNACESMPEGGVLSISTSEENGKVLISVADTGCGIKKENLEMIFEPFFTTKSVGKGTGLGLSVSYGIIRKHDGTMKVKSKEGEGTTFTITLPVGVC